MKNCFGYVRVSTVKQGEGVSLIEQKDAIEDYAQRHNLKIIRWFEEKQTAAKSGRPQFNEMLRLLRKGEAQGLVIHKIDRSVRNLKDWTMVSDLLDLGIAIHVVTEALDFNSRGGRLTADMLAVIASDFIRNHRTEVKKGQNGRLKQGLYPFRAPIGYLDTNSGTERRNRRGEPKRICPDRGPLIKEMFELYASDQHSLRSLQVEMKRLGLRSLSGRPVSLHGIETILNNPFYTGLIEIKRTGETFKGIHEPLISTALFKRVQDIKAGRSGKKVTRHNHLFQGVFRCGLCGSALSPERQKGRVYYRCHQKDCPTKTVREDVLDHAITQKLAELQPSEADCEQMEADWLATEAQQELEVQRRSLQLRLDECFARGERLTDLLVDGTITKEAFQSRSKKLALEKQDLTETLDKVPDLRGVQCVRTKFLELVSDLTGLYQCLEPDEKRILVHNVFSNCTVARKNIDFEPYDWLTKALRTLRASVGEERRHISRTAEHFEHIERGMEPLLELRQANEI